MSAIRALRQVSGLSAFAARTATRSFTRAALPAFRVTAVPATRAFSMTPRRFGEGACEYMYVYMMRLSGLTSIRYASRCDIVTEAL